MSSPNPSTAQHNDGMISKLTSFNAKVNMFKAPELEILKRKRSRPSDWWAAAPTTPQQQDEPLAKKRGGPFIANADGKGIKDAPAAGNRGKSAKGKEVLRNGENGEEDELHEKPARRGRSSGGREDLRSTGEGSRVAEKAQAKKATSTQGTREDVSAPKRRGRPPAVPVDELEDTVAEKVPATKKGRPSTGKFGAPMDTGEPPKQSRSARRGRLSHTEVEVRDVVKHAAQVPDTPKKRGRRPAAEKDVHLEADEDLIAPPKRRRIPKQAEPESPDDELVNENSTREEKKKRRSGDEILEAEMAALTTTEDYAKGRAPIAKQVLPSTLDHDRGRKRTRHSDAHAEEVHPTASSIVDQQERGPPRKHPSDAELRGAAMAGLSKQSKQSKQGRQRDQRAEVEAASSKLQSHRSGTRKGVKPAVEKRAKSSKGSVAAEHPRPKKRTRSSIEGVVAEKALESSKTLKKGSKRYSQEETQTRKRKDVESEFSITCFS
jgi:hypothetical protein